MKPKNLFLSIISFSLLLFTACKKSDVPATENEFETSFKIAADQATADNLTEDANDIMLTVADENNLMGARGNEPTISNFICATVTVAPLNGFPKTVTIDFGPLPGCPSPNGIIRSGKIIVVISDSLNNPNATATMTFDNYRVNGFKKEGTITWTNTSTSSVRSWRRQVANGKITGPLGNWWLHNGIKDIVQIAGVSTHHHPHDDEFVITGNGTTTNSAGQSRSHEIIEPLHKKWACRWIDQGKIRFQGPNHFSVLNYGNGGCDNNATITIDGQVTHNVILPG